MKAAQLRRLHRLAVAMRYADTADTVEFYAREIAGIVAEIDEADAAQTGSAESAAPPADSQLATRPPGRASTEPPPLAVETAPDIGAENVSRETRSVNRAIDRRRHPMFEDDPRALAECERDKSVFPRAWS